MMLVDQRFGKPDRERTDIQFLAGYFTAMINTLNIMKKQGYFQRIGEKIEVWVNGEACYVALGDLYRIIVFVRFDNKTEEAQNLVREKLVQIQRLFEEKYLTILQKWDQDAKAFEGFREDIKAIVE